LMRLVFDIARSQEHARVTKQHVSGLAPP
jgi:hypothetical protein